MEPRRPSQQEIARLHKQHYNRLTAVAYHILGEWELAQDAASDAFERLMVAMPEAPASWLTTVTTRIAIDMARSAQHQREEYIGPWLPEFVLSETKLEGIDLATIRKMQVLSPLDRGIIVLREVAGYSAVEIARGLRLTPAAVRQRLSRARRRLQEEGNAHAEISTETVHDLAQMLNHGDLRGFIELLSDGVVLWTDSGGHTKAARNPILGKEKVSRFIEGIFRKYGAPTFSASPGLGACFLVADSTDMSRRIVLETTGHSLTGIQVQQNHLKLL